MQESASGEALGFIRARLEKEAHPTQAEEVEIARGIDVARAELLRFLRRDVGRAQRFRRFAGPSAADRRDLDKVRAFIADEKARGREDPELDRLFGVAARKCADFAERNMRLSYRYAKRLVGRGTPLVDLIQEGYLAMLRAAERYDVRRGTRFSTYATPWIRQAFRRTILRQGFAVKTPVWIDERSGSIFRVRQEFAAKHGREPTVEELSEAIGISPEHVEHVDMTRANARVVSLDFRQHMHDGELDSGIERAIAKELRQEPVVEAAEDLRRLRLRLADAFRRRLTQREALVLIRRFGLNGTSGKTLREIGEEWGITRERVRQIERAALEKLRIPELDLDLG